MIVSIFAMIDNWIHFIMIEVFDLIFRIADVNIFGDTAIKDFTTRIYYILGVIILFKIVISAIQYLISPDKLLDKDKGIGGLLKRTIISVALLALVPTIFDFAKHVQDFVVEAIPQIILGQEIDTSSENGNISDTRAIAKDLSLMTLRAFILDKSTATDTFPQGKPAELGNEISDYLNLSTITNGCDWLGFGDGCVYDYNWIFSILVGAFMIYIFLSIGIDVGIRTIKMGILQILAPIPISSYINSEENFKAWYQMAFKVYADLFIRLILIYFIVYIIATLTNGIQMGVGEAAGAVVDFIKDPLLYIYIIIALLFFAKSAPKFICEALGIKSDGFGDIGAMFTRPFGLAGSVMAAKETFESNWKTQKGRYQGKGTWDTKGAKLKAAASAIAGSGSAFARGVWAVQSGSKGFRQVRDAARDAAVERRNERIDRDDNVIQDGYTLQDYKRDKHLARIGVLSQDKIIEMQNKNIVDARQSVDAQFAHALKKEEDFKGVVRIATDPTKGFGQYTNGDGNIVVADNVSLAYARRMAKISEGEYYDDGLTASRKNRILTDAQNDLNQAQTIYANAMQALKLNPDDVNYQVSFERAKADFERLQQRMFDLRNDANLGKARATSETAAEWDAIVRQLEKDIRAGVFADLLKKNDPDSVITHEKTIESIKLLRDNDKAKEIFAKIDGFGGSIGSLIEILENKSTGVDKNGDPITYYDVAPGVLDKLKVAMEGLVAETNKEARLAEERSKRTAKAKEAAKKS